jgi:hypothetical protein
VEIKIFDKHATFVTVISFAECKAQHGGLEFEDKPTSFLKRVFWQVETQVLQGCGPIGSREETVGKDVMRYIS